jgi:hypothetical protein
MNTTGSVARSRQAFTATSAQNHGHINKTFTATLTATNVTVIQPLKTATFEESGRDGGHLATLNTDKRE